MPNRIVREGFLDSEAINSLDHFTECMYHRLLIVSDDAGRFDGRAAVIASRCYPLRDNIRAKDVEKHLLKLVEAGLVIRYEWSGKPFLQLTKWQKCGKSETSKFPWVDGVFKIKYATIETRDGKKDFAITSLPHEHPITTPSPPHTNGVQSKNLESHTETETETETIFVDGDVKKEEASLPPKKTSPDSKSKAKAGSIEEVIAFCESLSLPASDGIYLWNHWEGNGWTNNGKKIKDWKATVRSWKDAGYLPSQKGGGQKGSSYGKEGAF